MDCSAFLERLHEGVDGELEGRDADEFGAHLGQCSACAAQVESVRKLKRLLLVKARREPLPPSLERRVRDAVAAEGDERAITPAKRWARRAALLAALVVVGFVLFLSDPLDFSGEVTPRLVHAEVVAESLAVHRDTNAEHCRRCRGLPAVMRSLVGVTPNEEVQAKNRLELVGWEHELLMCQRVRTIRMHYLRDGVKLTAFVFRGRVEPSAEERRNPKGKAIELPSGIVCKCCHSDDDLAAICFRAAGTDHVRVVIVMPAALEEEFLLEAADLHSLVSL